MRRLLTPLSALLLSVCLVTGCDSGESRAVTQFDGAGTAVTSGLPEFQPALDVRHQGVRRVDLYDRSVEPAKYLSYREDIAVDGSGEFSLTPVEALTEVAPDWTTFQLLQRSRARFLMRYRDFAVHDEALFLRNYTIRDLGSAEEIAGRTGSKYGVRRLDSSRSFELIVDDETSLILSAQEFDANGELLSAVVYESVTFETNFDRTVFHRSGVSETEHVLDRELNEVFEAPILVPRLLPDGYELREASTLIDDEGQHWAKLSFTDGIDTLFFAQALPSPGVSMQAPRLAQGDEVMVARMGSVTTVYGRIAQHRLMVLGKVTERAVLDLIESSLP